MNKFFILLILISTSAAACPNLAGQYATCTGTTGQMDAPTKIEIYQTIRNGITTYTMTSTEPETGERSTETFKTDGRTYNQSTRDPDTGVTFSQKTLATCVGDTLVLNVNITIENEAFAEIKSVMTKIGTEFKQISTGTSMGQQIQDTITCL